MPVRRISLYYAFVVSSEPPEEVSEPEVVSVTPAIGDFCQDDLQYEA